MSKVLAFDELLAVVGDLHFGIAPSNVTKFETLFESQKRFFTDCLIPTLIARGINQILFTGDLFDQRRRTDIRVLQFVEGLFENELKNFTCFVLQGNHDTYLKDDLTITSLSLIWSKPNVRAITKITPVKTDTGNVLLVPWLTSSLETKFIENVDKIKGKYRYAFGHFETFGFPYEAGAVSTHGLEPTMLYDTFENTISGHFHTASEKKSGNSTIHYVGTPCQMSFGDVGEEKGFWIYNLKTSGKEFIKNEVSAEFIKLRNIDELAQYDTLENKFVEFYYSAKLKSEEIFLIEKEVTSKNPISYKLIVNDINNISDLINSSDDVKVQNFEAMASAINSDDIVSMTKVFLLSEPYDDEDMVLDLILDLKIKKHG